MNDFFLAYCELINSRSQLAQCREAKSLEELLHTIKALWNTPDLDDNQLLAELNRLNRQIIDDASVCPAGNWFPYRYNAKTRSVYWCLPGPHATEPFQDETVAGYRQKILLNTIIQPQTSLESLAFHSDGLGNVQPSGLIFHLSRCGSTLVSGCLSELDSTCILSEPPVLTEILLDPDLDEKTRQQGLRNAINLQASAFPSRDNIVIKWNAWDIFRWKTIHTLYSKVPVIFLVRNPVEILASHKRSAGRHMSGESGLQYLNPVFADPEASLWTDYRVGVLSGLLSEMLSIATKHSIHRLDYSRLDLGSMIQICSWFGIPLNAAEIGRMRTRLGFHSKSPALRFHQDSAEKQQLLGEADMMLIQQSTMPLYHQFIENL